MRERRATTLRSAFAATLAVALGLGAAARSLGAQDLSPRGPAAPFVQADDWVMGALRRMDGLGLLPAGFDRGSWNADRVEALALLRGAVAEAEARRPDALPLAAGFLARLEAEAPRAAARAEGRVGWNGGGGVAEAGLMSADGRLLTALGAPPYVEADPAEIPAETTPLAGLDLSAYGGRALAARVSATADRDGVTLEDAHVAARPGPVRLWAGRRTLRVGPGDGGVVLSGTAPLDGAGLDTGPFRLPWILGSLGPFRLSTHLGRIGSVEPYGHPWMWILRSSVQPHPRLTLGVNKAAMVAATDQHDLEWLKQVAFVIIGKHPDGELDREDNQVASVDVRYRPPLSTLPVTLYLEWGLEDSAGAWRDVPGIVAGAYLAAVPGAPALAFGVEGATFGEMCCGNPWWYRHRGFSGGWTADRRPLGHPLGGEGTELAGRADLALAGGRVQLGSRLYLRERGEENLFAPTREGRSRGGSLEASVLLRSRFQVRLMAEHETGAGPGLSTIELRGGVRF